MQRVFAISLAVFMMLIGHNASFAQSKSDTSQNAHDGSIGVSDYERFCDHLSYKCDNHVCTNVNEMHVHGYAVDYEPSLSTSDRGLCSCNAGSYNCNRLVLSTFYYAGSANQNCYGYALGINAFSTPGIISDHLFSECSNYLDTQNLDGIANLVFDDLRQLGYNCVFRSKYMPNLTSVGGRSLICLRIGKQGAVVDYHFMKFAGFYSTNKPIWLHKPGDSDILMYKHESWSNTAWTSEKVKFTNPTNHNYYESIVGYDSDTYYFLFKQNHSTRYQSTDTYRHAIVCDLCSSTTYENHDMRTLNHNSSQHKRVCTKCSYTYYVDHTKLYSNYNSQKHKVVCGKCSYSSYEPHSYKASQYSSIYHKLSCSLCGGYKLEAHVPNALGTRCTVCKAKLNGNTPAPAGAAN
ncbi:MAG: hypothetical protein IKI64_11450 [Clostridia bacterium]|nr:hypothetical protein [Clostridia bacterium]